MISLVLFLALAAADPLQMVLQRDLSSAVRNDACLALRGNRSPEALQIMRKALADPRVRSCAEMNLQAAQAIDLVRDAAQDENGEVRAAGLRALGSFHEPEDLELLTKAAFDSQMIVSTNAMEGLAGYPDREAAPALLRIASQQHGMVSSLAFERLIRMRAPEAVALARTMIASEQVSDLLSALRVLGEMGAASDIASIEKVAERYPDRLDNKSGRGFGLMPSITLAKAAQTAIAQIRTR